MYLRIFLLGIISLMSLTIFSNELVNAEPSNKIPPWTKILGDWWLEERISDMEFIQSLTFMTNSGIIKIIENENKEIDIFDSILIENSKMGKFSIFYMSIENYGDEPYTGRISSPEPYSKNVEPEKIEVWLRQNQYFEKQIFYLNEHINLPKNTIIGLGECQEKKAYYNKDTKMIVICYEIISDIYQKLTEEYKSKGFTEKHISKITLDIVDFIFYHQVSRAILEIISNDKDHMITNNNEFFIDSLSNHIKSIIQKDKEKHLIESIVLWFKIMSEIENFKTPHMWDIHSFNLERLSKMTCQDSLFNSTKTLDYIQKGILAKQDIIECKSELLENNKKLEKITNQILK